MAAFSQTLKPKVKEAYDGFFQKKQAEKIAKQVVNSHVSLMTAKKQFKKTQYQSKNQKRRVIASDPLGTPDYGFIYVSGNPNDRKYTIKYIPIATDKPAEEMPLFLQSPPGAVLQCSMEGLGPEKPVKDSVLERKFKIVLCFGLYKTMKIPDPKNPNNEIEIITKDFDLFPIWSKFHIDTYFSNDPYDRKDHEKQNPKWEVSQFIEKIHKCENQAADFLLLDKDDIFKPKNQYKGIMDAAKNEVNEWAARKVHRYEELKEQGLADNYPKMSEDQWRKCDIGIEKYEEAKKNLILSTMGLPTDPYMSDDLQNLKTILINSYMWDLNKTSEGKGRKKDSFYSIAEEKANDFIEKHKHNILDRLVTVKFERPVWQIPEKKKDDRESDITAANTEYDKIKKAIKTEKPTLSDQELKKLADEKILEYITQVLQWKYNFPEIRDLMNQPVKEMNHSSAIDHYLKPHDALSTGTFISLKYFVNLSLTKGADMAFGLKLNTYSTVSYVFGSCARRKKSSAQQSLKCGISNEEFKRDFGDLIEFSKNQENEKESDFTEPEKHFGNFESSSTESVEKPESSYENPMNGVSLGSPKPVDMNEDLNNFQEQNLTEELEKKGGNFKNSKFTKNNKRGPGTHFEESSGKRSRR